MAREIIVELPTITEDGYIGWLDDLIRKLNNADVNTGGYGKCLACGGYHTWNFGVTFGCLPSKEPQKVH